MQLGLWGGGPNANEAIIRDFERERIAVVIELGDRICARLGDLERRARAVIGDDHLLRVARDGVQDHVVAEDPDVARRDQAARVDVTFDVELGHRRDRPNPHVPRQRVDECIIHAIRVASCLLVMIL
jgi:hypothetical protein